MNNKFKYTGAIHIHSKFSDGTGDIKTISEAAKKAGLSFIIITDHNSMEIEEGFINDVCVIRGEEITPKDANHYLALNIEKTVAPSENPMINVQEVKKQGGFGFCAHPDESAKRKNKYKELIWTDKTVYDSGIEIWNWFSSWADGFNDKNFFTQLYGYLFKNKIVCEPKEETLKWWDEVNNSEQRIISGIFGIDAHALKYTKYILPVIVFPYKFMFKTLANVILLDEELAEDFKTAKNQILTALKNGNSYMLSRQCPKLSDIDFCIKTDAGTACCGEEINLSSNTVLTVILPSKAEIKLLRNGELIEKTFASYLKYKIEKKGKYRLEIRENGHARIFTNPICVI